MTAAKKNLQALVPAVLRNRINSTVMGMQRLSPGYSLTRFVIDASEAHCARLEELHNDGQRWPQTEKSELPRGARIMSSHAGDSSRITPDDPEGAQ